jgi:hypothetical protein
MQLPVCGRHVWQYRFLLRCQRGISFGWRREEVRPAGSWSAAHQHCRIAVMTLIQWRGPARARSRYGRRCVLEAKVPGFYVSGTLGLQSLLAHDYRR